MKTILGSTCHALSVCATVVLLAGCGGLQTAAPPTEQLRNLALVQPLGTGFESLYSFKGPPDGANPVAALIFVKGALYGTTASGGSGCNSSGGCGTVFKVTTSGKESVLYRFKSGNDGAVPQASLISVNGVLFGTTFSGGPKDEGTVFKVSSSGAENVLYSFKGGTDGGNPMAALLNVKGVLYGTTVTGGARGIGTVTEISTSGKERVLYSFKGGADGEYPEAGLIDLNGTFYGTTDGGGAYGTGCYGYGCGTVFSVTTSGKESVLYTFVGPRDGGGSPTAGLIDVNGTLYGTTYAGGSTYCPGGYYCGTVFRVTTSGGETVLYNFKGHRDGANPAAPLIAVNGTLYGTTQDGGFSSGGTVFKTTMSGRESVLHSFAYGGKEGGSSTAGLTDVDGALYGSTEFGGTSGTGTVFRISP